MDKNDDKPSQGDSPNKGALKAGATIPDQEIKFPTKINNNNVISETIFKRICLQAKSKIFQRKIICQACNHK